MKNDMCVGCGMCANSINSIKIDDEGFLVVPLNMRDDKWKSYCPSYSHKRPGWPNKRLDYDSTWGLVLETRYGYSTSDQIRKNGSSGGAITAYAGFLLKTNAVDAVVTTKEYKGDVTRNETNVVFAQDDIINYASSRYSPSNPCVVVKDLILKNPNLRICFIGKPCDVSALSQFMEVNNLDRKQFTLISFFCAGIPSYNATNVLLKKLGLYNKPLKIRYRGNGWPGNFEASDSHKSVSATYQESWGETLNKYVHRKCKICVDGIGEYADLVCFDYWNVDSKGYPLFEEKDGLSGIIARTEKGRSIIDAAESDYAVKSERFDIEELKAIQPYQANRRYTSLLRNLPLIFVGRNMKNYGYPLTSAIKYLGLRNSFRTLGGAFIRLFQSRL